MREGYANGTNEYRTSRGVFKRSGVYECNKIRMLLLRVEEKISPIDLILL